MDNSARLLITGSVAYDYLMFFPGRFREHILPDELEHLSVSFLVDSMRKQRGGCATNVAYSLALLGERPAVMATVGQDFGEYRAFLEDAGVDTSAIVEVPDEFTSSFFVSTDQDNNQIASFYLGAMGYAGQLSFRGLNYKAIELAIISPNAPAAMCQYAAECRELGIPYIFDPSQQIIRLSGEDLVCGAQGARLLMVNEYEFGMIRNKTGLSEAELLALPQATIITLGADGSLIYPDGGRSPALRIPAVPPDILAEPTGVGDAYRAGIIAGLCNDLSWETTGRIGALAATYVLEQFGTQTHHYTLAEFKARYRRAFGDTEELDRLGQRQRVTTTE
jgi:adenosine kinase